MNLRIVLDSSVVVAAAVFRKRLAPLLSAWMTGRPTLVVTDEFLSEYQRVLRYRKFHLTPSEVAYLLRSEIARFTCRVHQTTGKCCRDADDDKFIGAALAAEAPLVTGDADLHARTGHIARLRLMTLSGLLAALIEWIFRGDADGAKASRDLADGENIQHRAHPTQLHRVPVS